MANPLVDLQKLVGAETKKSFTATVVTVLGQKVKVRLSTGNTMIVWGSADLNDTVMIVGKQIIAVVGQEDRPTVFIN
ncbi:MAG: hypothetical protein DRQ46_01530 [Gammaproteobacteria bacterium]|nr:MAG: hypothetical protein DRQ46_01530 [Gammaproteobacteria bacterium]